MKKNNTNTQTTYQSKRSTKIFPPLFIAAAFILSSLPTIIIGELIVKRLYPQNTYQIAQAGVVSVFKKSSILPFELKPNGHSRHLAPTHEFTNDIHTNSLGYRGPEFSKQKPANTIRILMLGDSTTFGIGSDDNQTFPFLLEEILSQQSGKKVEIINAGFASGLSPDTYYLYLKEIGLKLEPDIVFVNIFIANDISDLLENEWLKIDEKNLPQKINSKEREIDSQGRLVFRRMDWKYRVPIAKDMHLGMLALNFIEKKAPKLEKIIRRATNSPEIFESVPEAEQYNCIYLNQCTQRFEDQWSKIELLTKGFKNISQENNLPIIFVLLPAPFQLTEHKDQVELEYKIDVMIDSPEKDTKNYPQKRFIETANDLELMFFDLLPAIRFQKDPKSSSEFIYPQDGHFTPKGNLHIAQEYQKYLVNNNLLENSPASN